MTSTIEAAMSSNRRVGVIYLGFVVIFVSIHVDEKARQKQGLDSYTFTRVALDSIEAIPFASQQSLLH